MKSEKGAYYKLNIEIPTSLTQVFLEISTLQYGFAEFRAINLYISQLFLFLSVKCVENRCVSMRFDELNPINTIKIDFVRQNQKI